MIRHEDASDVPLVRAIHLAAFPTSTEADLVDALRENGRLLVSLVGLDRSQVVGHVAFSPVSMETAGPLAAGLGPVSVLPSHQR